jgi:hypothetical protein
VAVDGDEDLAAGSMFTTDRIGKTLSALSGERGPKSLPGPVDIEPYGDFVPTTVGEVAEAGPDAGVSVSESSLRGEGSDPVSRGEGPDSFRSPKGSIGNL